MVYHKKNLLFIPILVPCVLQQYIRYRHAVQLKNRYCYESMTNLHLMIHDLPCTICRRFLERKLLIRLVHDKFRRLMATWHVKITFDRESMSAPDGGESLERSFFGGNIDM